MKVVAINSIKPNPSNPRLIKDDKFHKLVQSLKDFPEMANVRPIVVNQDMIILGGNMRFKAMKEAKWKEVPVQVVDWDEAKQREFIIKDNVGFGEWDWDDLANNWDAEELEAWGLDVPSGFIEEAEAEEDDYEIPDEIQTDIVLGDLFEIGEHRLLCGDSTDSDAVVKLMNGKKADMVLTDPPYNFTTTTVNYKHNTKSVRKSHAKVDFISNFRTDELCNILNLLDINCIYIFCNKKLIKEYINQFEQYSFNILFWKKQSQSPLYSGDYLADVEYILYFMKPGKIWNTNNKYENYYRCREVNSLRNEIHPTTKPIELLIPFIENSSNINSLILDLFLGSGSTMVAAHQLRRKCYGMELEPKYCQVIVDRMLKLDPTLTIKRNGQPYLPEGTLQGKYKDAKPGES